MRNFTVLASLCVVGLTMLVIGGIASILPDESNLFSFVISLLFLLILGEMMVAGAGYFVMWIRFIRSDCQKAHSPYTRVRALGISCLGVLPNIGMLFLLPVILPVLFPASEDHCGGFIVLMMAYLIFFLSAVIMPLVGTITGFQRTSLQRIS